MNRKGYQVPTYTIVPANFAISPADIPSKFEHLWNAFDENETEISAGYILRYCQEQGSWAPFSFEQINAFYQRKPKRGDFTFNRLVEPGMHYGMPGERHLTGGGWIVKNEADGLYYITDDFIRRVQNSACRG